VQCFYEPWQYRPAQGYYVKVCHYHWEGWPPFASKMYYIIFYPSRPQYFYCFNPFSNIDPQGAFWCRCQSPLYPGFDPSQFSTLALWGQSHDINVCEPLFPQFSGTPAYYPGFSPTDNPNNLEPLPNLPSDLPS
jgi:hypothetical protein